MVGVVVVTVSGLAHTWRKKAITVRAAGKELVVQSRWKLNVVAVPQERPRGSFPHWIPNILWRNTGTS